MIMLLNPNIVGNIILTGDKNKVEPTVRTNTYAEVYFPSFTFRVWSPIHYGPTPVFCECFRDTPCRKALGLLIALNF